jgi:acetyl-CoA synthetase
MPADVDPSAVERPVRIAPRRSDVPPNLGDYAATRAGFDWSQITQELDDGTGHPPNIGYLAVDRHVAAGRGQQVAIRWLSRHGAGSTSTYAELKAASDRFAEMLARVGVEPGDCVFSLLGRTPELVVAALGTLKHRATFCPLFSAFGPEPIATRMAKGRARVLVTTARLYDKKVAPIRESLPDLEHVFVIDEPVAGTVSLQQAMAASTGEYEIGPTEPETPALLHFTSGTTGTPKGALHVHAAIASHYATGRWALDLRPGDTYWCTADPGWVTGTSYGIVAPLTCGVTMILDEGEFDARRWYETLVRERVDVWYTAPTAIRMLMRAGLPLAQEFDLSHVRLIASVGEPLNPEAIFWGLEAFGQPILDNWWQTETGGIMIANLPGLEIKPGSMGVALPGIDARIVREGERGIEVLTDPGAEGEIALRVGWPSMFRAYLGEAARYDKCFEDGWYRSGDLARRDAEGYFWFLGRADDVIKSAGHLIGPFEVESALMEHPAVVEVGVIGKPDPVAGAVVKAFVSCRPEITNDASLRRDLMAFARRRLGSAVAPREIEIVDRLPKTRSGKIMRRLLLARELGLPEGDTSTLEVFE